VPGARVPRPGVVVRHQVYEVELRGDARERPFAVVLRAGGRRDREFEVRFLVVVVAAAAATAPEEVVVVMVVVMVMVVVVVVVRLLPAAAGAERLGVCVQRLPHLLQQQHEVLGLLGGGGILPVDVDAVEAEVLDELDAALGEALAAGWGGGWRVEVFGRVGVRPAADGEEHFEVAVALLEQEELLDAAVDVGAHVVP